MVFLLNKKKVRLHLLSQILFFSVTQIALSDNSSQVRLCMSGVLKMERKQKQLHSLCLYLCTIPSWDYKKLTLWVASALISLWFLLLSPKTFVIGKYGKLFICIHPIESEGKRWLRSFS